MASGKLMKVMDQNEGFSHFVFMKAAAIFVVLFPISQFPSGSFFFFVLD